MRRVRDAPPAAPPMSLRDRLLAKYEPADARFRDRGRVGTGLFGVLVDNLKAGRPVVLAGWQLRAVRPAEPARTVDGRAVAGGTMYRVDPDGSVVEVVARRDPDDRMSIIGWDEVGAASGRSR